jgi:hypothetical protein
MHGHLKDKTYTLLEPQKNYNLYITYTYTYIQCVPLTAEPGSGSGLTDKDFPKYGTPGSVLSGRKRWSLPAHVMMSSHSLHKEVSPLQISLQCPHWW